MARSVRTFLPVVGDPASLTRAFEGDPARWLPASRRTGPDEYLVTLRAGAMSQQVAATIGSPWRSGATRWRSLTWEPTGVDRSPRGVDRLLPSLDGELGLNIEAHDRVTLIFDGRYEPPGGAVGTAVDVVALNRVADATIQRLVEDVTARLSAEATLLGGSAHRSAPRDHGPASIRA
ncbi:MAG: hypothetical protein EA388_03560 [Nitriliruptor sp.]|nr:MAG: hypothetical protein EA388_03560 [Nitriliruptor sp.]